MAEEEPNVPLDEPADDAAPETAEAAAPPTPPPSAGKPLILLTAGVNFVGTHVLDELLKSNKYTVRVPVAHSSKQLERWSPSTYPIEVVVTDVWKTASWPSLVADCTYVIHSAAPNFNKKMRQTGQIDHYVKRSMKLLEAAKEEGTVKRVVFVSSIGAVTGPALNCINKTYTEEDWPDMASLPFKCRGKLQVELEAWKYVRSFPDGQCFQFTVVNPACVMGPLLSKLVAPGRIELHRLLMEHKVKRVPDFNLPIVDVRDVATAIVNALTAEGAANKRHLLSADNMWYTETAQILADEFTKFGYDVPTRRATYTYLWIHSMFNKQCRKWLPIVNKEFKLDNTRMQTVLGVKPRSTNTTVIDMGYSMIDIGLVKKPLNYTARASV